ncbi:SOS response-associated peptidase [Rhodovibrio salinarum]|uniref:Abasic site processing protein n=1 Tax=Rhodovibrio salinarum TaxID=1087 RepID=A0A934QLK4_9PROT|nr:SOS response-associated peptidase [Rhodovibrio salinarum]MBK1698825.1 SOS response-associated peptidase [Rhodovibrio salinarum]
MCGRYSITSPPDTIQRIFQVPELPNLPARYNVAPTQDVPVVRVGGDQEGPEADGGRHLVQLRWGLVPFWADDPSIGVKMINARADSASDKPAFRAAFRRRRCLVVADGFYEWQAAAEKGQRKQPYRIEFQDRRPFGFAGLWERWTDPQTQSVLETCTILTTEANDALKPIHPRMPVILAPEAFDAWLAPESNLETAKTLLRSDPGEDLTAYPISTRVNAVKNDDPALLEPLETDDRLSRNAARGDHGSGDKQSGDSDQPSLF